MPMARAGTAEEVAETVLFLLSEASSYTTGTICASRVGDSWPTAGLRLASAPPNL